MNEDWRVVFESRNWQSCYDRALVLTSLNIPHQVINDGPTAAIVVPAEYSAQSVEELALYEEENPIRRPVVRPKVEVHDPLPGLIGYFLLLCLVAGLAGFSWFGLDWKFAGRIDGELIRNGEVWRLFTALTLHADLRHLLSNLGFGVFFGLFAGRLLGSGYAWLTIVLAAALANATNVLLLDPDFLAIGASTAVFAALGLIAGYVWRGKLMPQEHDRWTTRWGPVVGGIALLMFTGGGSVDPETGVNNTDVGAHFFGFVMGFLAGVLLIRFGPLPGGARRQLLAGGVAVGLVLMSWSIALAH